MGCVESSETKAGGACFKLKTGYVKAVCEYKEKEHPILSGIDALDWQFLTESGFTVEGYGKLEERVISIDGMAAKQDEVQSKWLTTLQN